MIQNEMMKIMALIYKKSQGKPKIAAEISPFVRTFVCSSTWFLFSTMKFKALINKHVYENNI